MSKKLKKYFDFDVMYDFVVLEPYLKSFSNLKKYLDYTEDTVLMMERGENHDEEFNFKGNFSTYHNPDAIEKVGESLYKFITDKKDWNKFISLLEKYEKELVPLMAVKATNDLLDKLVDGDDFGTAYNYWYQIYTECVIAYLLTDGRYHEYSISQIKKDINNYFKNTVDVAPLLESKSQSIFKKADQEILKMSKLFKEGNVKWEKEFECFIDKYIWLYLADTHYDFDDVVDTLKKQIRSTQDEIKNKVGESLDLSNNILNDIPENLVTLIKNLRELGFQRMEMRRYWQWLDYLIHQIFDRFEQKHNLPSYFLAFTTNEEASDFLKNYTEKKKKDLALKRKVRLKQVAAVLENGNISILSDKNSIEVLKNRLCENETKSELIYGQIAYKDEGRVTGIARVIKWTKSVHDELNKIEKGDILVVTQTKPEFLPFLKKVKAIVADEGGITSHVAIVSRELKIPSIIGTRNATSFIKTGDNIEIDFVKSNIRTLK